MSMTAYIKKLGDGETLSIEEAQALFEGMMEGGMTDAEIACALTAMRMRTETADEIAGASIVMNRYKTKFPVSGPVYDTCGTGGDGKSTVNVSSAVSVIVAAAGCAVVKHGNAAMSGKVGSADIFRLAGVPVDVTPEAAAAYFQQHKFVFLLAPLYHPALKYAGKVRREIKIPTIFNILGPLANPADPAGQVIGISRREKLPLLADAVQKLGRSGVAIYSSQDGYDEISSHAPTEVIEIDAEMQRRYIIRPERFFDPFPMPVVEDNETAIRLFSAGISGTDMQIADIFSLNAGFALHRFGKADTLEKGYTLAKELIMSGKVADTFAGLGGASC